MGQDSQWQGTGVDMEGKVPQCQDHRQEGSQSNGSGEGVGGGLGWTRRRLVRERERQEGDRRAAVEQQHGTKERESRKLSWGSSG